jgi:hypothetical protein
VFVTSQGHLPAQFARACERGNYMLAAALAAELKPLSLVQALDLLPLIAEHEPARYEAAAVRWHARWESEGRRVDLPGASLALAALRSLSGSRRTEAVALLRALV